MFLHILPGIKHGYTFFDFIAKSFDIREHTFVFIEHNKEYKEFAALPESKSSLYQKYLKSRIFEIQGNYSIISKSEILQPKKLNSFAKIFLHGIYDFSLINYLIWKHQDIDFSRVYYVPLGPSAVEALIYNTGNSKSSMNFQCHNFVNKIENIVGTSALYHYFYTIRSKATKNLAKPKLHYCIYPSNVFETLESLKLKAVPKSKAFIMVGHTAARICGHEEVFRFLSHNLEGKYKIFSPLSYNDENYKNEIISIGDMLLDKKFKPITNFLDHDVYETLLVNLDAAIFNQNRHIGMANLIFCLGLGKKVYIRDDYPGWQELVNDFELKLYSTNKLLMSEHKINTEELVDIPNSVMQYNIEKINNLFSRTAILQQWSNLFAKNDSILLF